MGNAERAPFYGLPGPESSVVILHGVGAVKMSKEGQMATAKKRSVIQTRLTSVVSGGKLLK